MKNNQARVELIPIFDDNYVFVLINEQQDAVVVDPGHASEVHDFLTAHQLVLKGILLTHHHHDHIGGLRDLLVKHPAPVFAPAKNKMQIQLADHWVSEGDVFSVANFDFSVVELPGHTLGHVAFLCQSQNWLFSGDVLFGLGCGRLFEGTPEQMFESLQRIKRLPESTLIFCTHEYTEANLRFCKMLSSLDDSPITGDNEELALYANQLLSRRELGLPSVPLKLSIENKVNPFLLARSASQFAYLRDLRNRQ